MSRGLKELKELIIKLKSLGYTRCDEWLGFIIIEKELKALEIIKKYNVRPSDYHYNTTYDIYLCNISFAPVDEIMSEEEYNLLKEVINA